MKKPEAKIIKCIGNIGNPVLSCLEEENALDKHPDIIESCVCGIEDDKFGEIVGAYIYSHASIIVADLV